MAPHLVSISSTIRIDITAVVDKAIAEPSFESTKEIRTIAVETLDHFLRIWSSQSRTSEGEVHPLDRLTDKLHLGYTAGHFLNKYRDLPNAVPVKLVSCLTKHIEEKREITVGELEGILRGVRKAKAMQVKNMKEEEDAAEAALGATDAVEEKGGMDDVEGGAVLKEQGKKRKGAEDVSDSAVELQPAKKKSRKSAADELATGMPTLDTGDHFKLPPTTGNPITDLQAFLDMPILTTAKASKGTPKNKGSKNGPGNFSKVSGVRWHPDEHGYFLTLIQENPEYQYQHLADLAEEVFSGTRYTDPESGKEYPAVRGARDPDAVRQRFSKVRQAEQAKSTNEEKAALKAAAKAAAKAFAKKRDVDGKAAESSGSPADGKTGSEGADGGEMEAGKESRAGEGTSTGEGMSGGQGMSAGNGTSAGNGMNAGEKTEKPAVATEEGEGKETVYPEPVRMVVTGALYKWVPVDGPEVADEEEEEDEDPLGDLDDMVAAHEAGKL